MSINRRVQMLVLLAVVQSRIRQTWRNMTPIIEGPQHSALGYSSTTFSEIRTITPHPADWSISTFWIMFPDKSCSSRNHQDHLERDKWHLYSRMFRVSAKDDLERKMRHYKQLLITSTLCWSPVEHLNGHIDQQEKLSHTVVPMKMMGHPQPDQVNQRPKKKTWLKNCRKKKSWS